MKDIALEIKQRLEEEVLFFSGAMGTIIQKHSDVSFMAPEELNLHKPLLIKKILSDYVDVGVDFIETNTFGGTELKLRESGVKDDWRDLVSAGVRIAREIADSSLRRIYVIGNIGPIGKLIEPLGEIDFDTAYKEFYKQAEVLLESGVDGILLETMSCIVEAKAAYLAVRDAGARFVMVQMTYSENGSTDTGTPPAVQSAVFEALRADVIGANCSVGPDKMVPITEALRKTTSLPISIQANAGIPYLKDGKTVFPMGPEEYHKYAIAIYEAGANIIGGCCGTTPLHLKLIVDSLRGKKPVSYPLSPYFMKATALAGRGKIVYIGSHFPIVKIGEKINPSARKELRESLKKGDFSVLRRYVVEQKDSADVLDINVAIEGIDEYSVLRKALSIVENIGGVPVSLDSPNAEVLGRVSRYITGKGLLNSTTGERSKYEVLLEYAKRYGHAVVLLPMDEDGIPDEVDKRLKIVERVLDYADKIGFRRQDILVDGLVMTIGARVEPRIALSTIREVKRHFGLNTIIGLSNISFGLPSRRLLNRAYMVLSIYEGLDAAIMDVLDRELISLVYASSFIAMRDERGANYITYATNSDVLERVGATSSEREQADISQKVYDAVLMGDKEGIVPIVKEALKKHKPMDIINKMLIPAITKVGDMYERGEYFLPQLILSAETMKLAFKEIEPILRKEGIKKEHTIVIATVKGDIHDIGKNIVAIMLENAGFRVVDIGKDVPREKIFESAIRERADIVALSALMTTTMIEMPKVIEFFRDKGYGDVPFMIGGAVISKGFANKIGAFYSKDAVEAVRVAKEVIKKYKGVK